MIWVSEDMQFVHKENGLLKITANYQLGCLSYFDYAYLNRLCDVTKHTIWRFSLQLLFE